MKNQLTLIRSIKPLLIVIQLTTANINQLILNTEINHIAIENKHDWIVFRSFDVLFTDKKAIVSSRPIISFTNNLKIGDLETLPP